MAQAMKNASSSSEQQMQEVANQLQESMNKKLKQAKINLRVAIAKDSNGNYAMYFTDKNGKLLGDEEMKKQLNEFKNKILSEMNGKDFVLAMGMLKQNGLSAKEFNKINKSNESLLDSVENNAKNILKNSEFVLTDEIKSPPASQQETGEYEESRRAYLITQQQWDNLWRSARRSEFIAANAYFNKDLKSEMKRKIEESRITHGISVNVTPSHVALMAPQTHQSKDDYTVVTGVFAGGRTAKGVVAVRIDKDNYTKFRDRTRDKLLDVMKNADGVVEKTDKQGSVVGYVYEYTQNGEKKQIDLIDESGNVNKKGLRLMLWLKRTGGTAKNGMYSSQDMKQNRDMDFIDKFRNAVMGDELFNKIYANSNTAYRRKFGDNRRLSRGGYASALGYAILTYEEKKSNKRNTSEGNV